MDLFEPKKKKTFREFFREHRTGIYGTIIFHLIILIVLLGSRLHTVAFGTPSILIDFSEQERKTAQEILEKRKERTLEIASKELNAAINTQVIRNVVVDNSETNNNSQPLKDDRKTNATQLYDDARRVQEKIDASRAEQAKSQGSDEIKMPEKKPEKKETYKGPSVISYDLGGRKALSLPVPAYQCQGGGDVKVEIKVNPQGRVTVVSIIEAESTKNICLHDAAKRFAKSSRFELKNNAPARQQGYIVYRFIAQ